MPSFKSRLNAILDFWLARISRLIINVTHTILRMNYCDRKKNLRRKVKNLNQIYYLIIDSPPPGEMYKIFPTLPPARVGVMRRGSDHYIYILIPSADQGADTLPQSASSRAWVAEPCTADFEFTPIREQVVVDFNYILMEQVLNK